MTMFQLILLAATAFFAYQVYRHVQGLDGPHIPQESMPVQDVESLIDQADEAYEAGDLGGAKALLSEADVLAPNTPDILNKLAYILAKEGDMDRALEHYKASLAVDADDDMVHAAMASIYRQRGENEVAQMHYQRALEIDDSYAITHFNYANLLVDMAQFEAAKKEYARALELDYSLEEAREELAKLESEQV